MTTGRPVLLDDLKCWALVFFSLQRQTTTPTDYGPNWRPSMHGPHALKQRPGWRGLPVRRAPGPPTFGPKARHSPRPLIGMRITPRARPASGSLAATFSVLSFSSLLFLSFVPFFFSPPWKLKSPPDQAPDVRPGPARSHQPVWSSQASYNVDAGLRCFPELKRGSGAARAQPPSVPRPPRPGSFF